MATYYVTLEDVKTDVDLTNPDPDPGGNYDDIVTSFNGRRGPVTTAADDYTASLVTNDSSVTGANVDDALNTIGGALTTQYRIPVVGATAGSLAMSTWGINAGAMTAPAAATIGASTSLGITTAALTTSGSFVATNAAGIKTLAAATQDAVALVGRAGGIGSWTGSITPTTLSASRTYTLPDHNMVFAGSAAALTATYIPVAGTDGILQNSLLIDNIGTGALTLVKTGTTARTVTFPDRALSVAGVGAASTSQTLSKWDANGDLTDSLIAQGSITGLLTFAKTGTTARTVTFPDADFTVGNVLGGDNLTTQYRVVFVDSAGVVTESSSIVTDASGNLLLTNSLKPTTDTLEVLTTSGTNTNTYLEIKGKGTGIGILRAYDEDDAEYLSFSCTDGYARMTVGGSSVQGVDLQYNASVPVALYRGSTPGETKPLEIYGNAAGTLRKLSIACGSDADNRASFYGVTSYNFDGTCQSDAFRVGTSSPIGSELLTVAGDVSISIDSAKLLFGAGQDASILYDGTDIIYNSQEVGTGDHLFTGGPIRQEGIFAEIYVADGSTAQSIATGVTYTKLTGFTTDGESSNCTAAAASDKITITKAGKYRVQCAISGTSGTNNITFKTAAFLNGVEIDKIHCQRKISTAGDSGSMSLSGIIDVTTVPWDLDIRMRHDDGGAINFTPIYMNLSTSYLGET